MIKITVIALASLKEKYLKDAAAEYIKRLGAYCDLKIIELDPVRLPEKPSDAEINSALEREAELILKKIPAGDYVVPLCIEGKQLSSEEFSGVLEQEMNIGRGVTFIIGSSCGLADMVKRRADLRLSFSKMTFPHQLFRVMLLEQIYRAFKICSGGAYHK
ncbi:MAG: 23S rRNA (pseudouridine(1915)-N(3))-methyltransferase RlmH [Acutalibacteraceae bacterium]|nr:23S rRNA (pseudouridine(1915)-N(3))-methyltransferase RlmH [Acutalibacteraceae bacterium]